MPFLFCAASVEACVGRPQLLFLRSFFRTYGTNCCARLIRFVSSILSVITPAPPLSFCSRRVSNIHVLPKEKVPRFVANIVIEEAVRVGLQQPGITAPAHSSRGVGAQGEKHLFKEDDERGHAYYREEGRRRVRKGAWGRSGRGSSGRSPPDWRCVRASVRGRWLTGCGARYCFVCV